LREGLICQRVVLHLPSILCCSFPFSQVAEGTAGAYIGICCEEADKGTIVALIAKGSNALSAKQCAIVRAGRLYAVLYEAV
jgi:hypothetical protein